MGRARDRALVIAKGWVRLFYRNGKSEAFRVGPQLDRALARKVPIVVHQAPALWHRCQVCGAEGVWGEGWIGWARWGDRHELRGEGDDIYCSDDCCRAENPNAQPPRWIRLGDEPMPRPMARALYSAQREAADAVAQGKAYRRVPMIEWPGEGFCKWCARPIDKAKEPRRLYWHSACAEQFNLHTHLLTQSRFLHRRDGPLCAIEGCESRWGEVDHRVPLWRVRDLPPLLRRPYYGPLNLWGLCSAHHAEKTKREAAERAQIARESGELPPALGPALFPIIQELRH
jgi:hypothetical protein